MADISSNSYLDEIMYRHGVSALSETFGNLAIKDKTKALTYINHINLQFNTLYSLKTHLEELDLEAQLSPRNKSALAFVKTVENKRKQDAPFTTASCKTTRPEILEWILDAGCKTQEQDTNFTKVLDTAIILLTKLHNRKNHASKMRDMLFSRYRKEIFSHNLVWAFFELRLPASLYQLAEGLLSQHEKDFELTCKLLWFIPGINNFKIPNKLALYYNCTEWIYENIPFMYYTGESFQQSCKPIPYNISYEAKYLYKMVEVDTGIIKDALSEYEKHLLSGFKNLNSKSRQSLADYSYALCRLNPYLWTLWLCYPLAEQIKIVKLAGGL